LQVIAQGLIGLVDPFIHTSYVSAVSPSYSIPIGWTIAGLALGVILFGVGLYLYILFQTTRRRNKVTGVVDRRK